MAMQTEPLPSFEGLADAELVAAVRASNPRAMEALMRRHNRTLYRTARAILRDDAEAEDAVQEAHIRAYRALEGFRGESKLSTWLVRIVANEALMRRRRRVRSAEVIPMETGEQPETAEMANDASPGLETLRGQMRELLAARIDRLPDAYRAVFVLREALARDIDITMEDAFGFAGARCDGIVRKVLEALAMT